MFFRRKKLFSKPLKILIFTNGLILVAGAMLGPIYALFVEEIGGDLLDASLVGAVFALAAGLTTLASGSFVDRVKQKKHIVVAGYTIVGIGFLLLTTVHSIYTLFLVQALIGIGEAIYSPAFDAVYSEHLDHHKEGRQWSLWESMYYFTTFAGAVIGGLIANTWDFQVLFVVMAILCLSSACYLLIIPKKSI